MDCHACPKSDACPKRYLKLSVQCVLQVLIVMPIYIAPVPCSVGYYTNSLFSSGFSVDMDITQILLSQLQFVQLVVIVIQHTYTLYIYVESGYY